MESAPITAVGFFNMLHLLKVRVAFAASKNKPTYQPLSQRDVNFLARL